MNQRFAALLLAGIACTVLAQVVIPSAGAYVLSGSGCRFDPANDDDGLGIGFSSTNYSQARRDATVDAAGRWNWGTTPQFTLVSYGLSTRDVRVEFSYLGAEAGPAYTIQYCHPGQGYYRADPVFIWNVDVWQYNYNERVVTAEHELGHTYGLAHNQNYSCDGWWAGIMFAPSAQKVTQCNWTWPTPDDFAGQVDAHNG